MRLMEPQIPESRQFIAFFLEEAGDAGLFEGPDGKPMVFYRGTQSRNNLLTNLGLLSFTTDLDVAKTYSAKPKYDNFKISANFEDGSTVGSYHLKMTNPMEVKDVSGTILDFIEEYLGGIKKVGKEEVLKLLSYLANRESGKARGPHFQYGFTQDADDYIDGETLAGIKLGPSLRSLVTTVKRHYEEGSMAGVKDALDAVVLDYFVLIDAPAFKRLAQAAGHDGIIHTDAFEAGAKVSRRLLGKDVKDRHLTYRPFDKSQVVPISTQSMSNKKDLKEGSISQPAAAQAWYHGTSAEIGRLIAKDKAIIPGKSPQQDRKDAQGDPDRVYLANSKPIAEQYARRRGGKKGVVVEVDGSAIDWNKAEPDEEVLVWMYQNWDADRGHGSEKYLTPEDIQAAFGPDNMDTIEDRASIWGEIVEWIKKDAPKHVRQQWEKFGSQRFWEDMPALVLEALPRGTPLWEKIMRQAWSISVLGPVPARRIFSGNKAMVVESMEALEDIEVSSIETGNSVKGYLYHGSREDGIEELDPYAPSYPGSLGWGLYLAEEPEASNYGKYVYRVPVELKNPFRIEHSPIEYDPYGDSIESMIDPELLQALRDKGESFKNWYESWAGFNAEFNQPYGRDVEDVIYEKEGLPEEFIQWMREEDRPMASSIAKKLLELDAWYDKSIQDAMAEAREKQDPALYKEQSARIREEHKKRLDAIGMKKLEELWDEWPDNNIPSIPSSTLVGENVSPFWFWLGDKIVGCFDDGDMENIGSMVREAGHDSMVVEGLRSSSSFLGHEVVLFRSAIPDQVNGEPIQREDITSS